jgi:formylglycine-generating enzyme required for sulfatase activity
MQPITYASAEAFLADTKHPEFDCLVLDIRLSGMSGIELGQRLVAEGGHIPVIYMTAHDDPEARAGAEAAGCAVTSARPIPLTRCSKPSGGWSHEPQEMKTARSFILLACVAAVAGAEPAAEKAAAPPAMTWIPGGTFLMGTDDTASFPNERPSRRVHVNGFWIDEYDITNAEFAKFVEATGYVTTAERPAK